MRRRLLAFLSVPALAAGAALALFGGGAAPATAQQPTPAPSTQQTEAVELFRACNNVSLTWVSGTQTSVVASSITPATALIAIWRFNNVAQTFTGYSAEFPDASDLRTVNIIDAVFVCMNAPGTLNRPALSPGG